jgi:hypothetical protein
MGQRGRGWERELPEGFEEWRDNGRNKVRRCWARTKSTGKQCTQPAASGQKVCRFHGGAAAQNVRAGERRVAEAELDTAVRKQLAQLDADPVDNPLTALSELAGQMVAFKNALADRVNDLSEIRYQGGAGEQIRAEIVLYERAMDRCNSVLTNMARLNIDERLAKVTEQQAEKLVSVIDALLAHLSITGEQAAEAKHFLARRLRSA